jgi:hypothetical protein
VIETLFCIITFAAGWWLRGYYDRMMDTIR